LRKLGFVQRSPPKSSGSAILLSGNWFSPTLPEVSKDVRVIFWYSWLYPETGTICRRRSL
jgi:hypothetical protein